MDDFDTSQEVQLDVTCSGDPIEQGEQQGHAVADKIRFGLAAIRHLENFRLKQPKWMPYFMFRKLAERRAKRKLYYPILESHPNIIQKLKGISKGSQVPIESLLLMNAMEAVMSSLKNNTYTPEPEFACSAVAIEPERSLENESAIFRNFDYIPLVRPFFILRKTQPKQGFRSLEFSVAPLAGAVDGINEAGLAITFNYAYAVDKFTSNAPISMSISEALQHCRTVDEAVEHIGSRPRWGGGLLMLADADGNIASLQLSNTRYDVLYPDHSGILYHTNHYQTPKMQEVEISPDAIYSDTAPEQMRGRNVLESALRREQRYEELLNKEGEFSFSELHHIGCDHGEEEDEGNLALCMHSEHWNTTASVRLFPKQLKMRIAYQASCQAEYKDFYVL